MATPRPGEIRCPTCHRSTPPAGFCTQCGSAIPPDARIRPRGLDREELQERIRARRSGAEPYRRGGAPGESPYERFTPEPEDAAARRAAGSNAPRRDLLGEAPPPPPRAAPIGDRGDITRDRDEWASSRREHDGAGTAPPIAPVVPFATAAGPRPDEPIADVAPARYDEPARDEHAFDPGYDDQRYDGAPYDAQGYEPRYDAEYPAYTEYQEWEDEREGRRSAGAGALAILGFLALGVLALLGGAVLAGVFSGDDSGQGQALASPSPSASVEPPPASEVPFSAAPERSEAAASATPRASGDTVVFPDGFTAEVQPCIPGSSGPDGCDMSGAVNGGQVEIWVGFEEGTDDDVIGVQLIGPNGSAVGTGSIPLSDIGCSPTCARGWAYVSFSQLPEGMYEVVVTRNGDPAGETSFTVS